MLKILVLIGLITMLGISTNYAYSQEMRSFNIPRISTINHR